MRTAVSIPPFTDATTLVAMAVEAEAAGWDGVFLWDHLVFDADARHDVLDPWVLLGAIAQATERVRLGTMVTPLARRRPWVVAKHVTTLDHLSGGRATLSVGLGDPPDADFAAFGDEAGARPRADLLDEGLAVVDGLLRGPLAHSGAAYQVDSEVLPRPVQTPRPPIWVAGVAPRPRPLVRAQRWDGVVPIGPEGFMTPDEVGAYLDGVDRPDGWDVVVPGAPGVAADDYEAVGATWVVDGVWPEEGWVAEFRTRINAGP
jgi:alkanesulfonate monooxygenase SsuD/methylene tetrahydromethanopterin reductase-like flavin-dependent oxidoreductase (luciferase family)